jgi:hypothetical protein
MGHMCAFQFAQIYMYVIFMAEEIFQSLESILRILSAVLVLYRGVVAFLNCI